MTSTPMNTTTSTDTNTDTNTETPATSTTRKRPLLRLPPPHEASFSSYGMEWQQDTQSGYSKRPQRSQRYHKHKHNHNHHDADMKILDVAWIVPHLPAAEPTTVAGGTSQQRLLLPLQLVAGTSQGDLLIFQQDSNGTKAAAMNLQRRISLSTKPIRSLQVVTVENASANTNANTHTHTHTHGEGKDDTTTSSSSRVLVVGGDDGLWSLPMNTLSERMGVSQLSTPYKSKQYKWSAVDYPVSQLIVHKSATATTTATTTATATDADADATVYVLDAQGGRIRMYDVSHQSLLLTIPLNLPRTVRATTLAVVCPTTHQEDVESEGEGDRIRLRSMLLIGTNDSRILIWNGPASSSGCETEHEHEHEHGDNKDDDDDKGAATLVSLSLPSLTSSPLPLSVTSIATTHNGQWWTIAATKATTTTAAAAAAAATEHTVGGLLATWHGPSRTLVAKVETRESIHKIATSGNNGNGNTTDANTLYSVANQGVVTKWNSPFLLHVQKRLWCQTPSGYAIAATLPTTNATATATSPVSGMIVVGGVGPTLDLLQDDCVLQTLDCRTTTTTKQ